MSEVRQPRNVRLSKAGVKAIQDIATRDGVTWGEAARRMLAYASTRMPEGWHPGKEKQ